MKQFELNILKIMNPIYQTLEADLYTTTAKQNYCIGLYLLKSKQDYNLAFDYLEDSARRGYPLAYFTLASVYYFGLGKEQNLDLALKLVKLAVKNNLSIAKYYLGKYYLSINKTKLGLEYLNSAAADLNLESTELLAEIFESGLYNIKPDKTKSKELKKQIKYCTSKSNFNLENLDLTLDNLDINPLITKTNYNNTYKFI